VKITRRQLRKLLFEIASKPDSSWMDAWDRQWKIRHEQEFAQDPAWDSDADTNDPEDVTSQDMADAHRYAGDSDESQAKYLGISVEDWRRIRGEMDDWYEERHMLDQMEFDDDPDLNDDGELDTGELRTMIDKIGEDL